MARGPKTPCAGGCGRLLWRTSTSSAQPKCVSCRRAARQRVCEQCGRVFERSAKPGAVKLPRFCSQKCGNDFRNVGGRKAANRARRAAVASTNDGIIDMQIWDRDDWLCLIPGCKLGPLRVDLRKPESLSPSVDHIVPLSLGGADTAPNKRSAHLFCNLSRNNRMCLDDVAMVTPELAPLGLLPARARSRVNPWCPVHGSRERKPVALPWPRRLYCRPCRFCGVTVTGFKPPRSKDGTVPEFTVCQACQADAKCSLCGKSMYITPFSSPAAERVCQLCQRHGFTVTGVADRPAPDVADSPVPPERAAPLTLGQFRARQEQGVADLPAPAARAPLTLGQFWARQKQGL
jgi:hypothetical protein